MKKKYENAPNGINSQKNVNIFKQNNGNNYETKL